MKLFAVLMAAACLLPLARGESLVLSNVTVIDLKSADPRIGMSVVIEGNRIVEIRSSRNFRPPESAKIVDYTGRFLIPGLWDMHGHLTYCGESALTILVAYGVVGVRDPGCKLDQIDGWRREIADGLRIGPEIKRSGPFVDGPKKLSPFRASFTEVITSEDQGRKIVRSLKKKEVDFIKVHGQLPREAFFAVADEARKQHLPLVVHAPQDVTAIEASDAGARTIEHTESLLGDSIYVEPQSLRDQRIQAAIDELASDQGKLVFSRLAANGTWVTPTLIAHFRGFANSSSAFERAFPGKLLEIVRRLHQAGVRLLAGSDFNFKDSPIRAAIDLHEELALFVEAGMTPLEALKTATRNAAESMDLLRSTGTIEEGKRADLVILEADPLENREDLTPVQCDVEWNLRGGDDGSDNIVVASDLAVGGNRVCGELHHPHGAPLSPYRRAEGAG